MKHGFLSIFLFLFFQTIYKDSFADVIDTSSKIVCKYQVVVLERRTRLPLRNAEVKFINLRDLTELTARTDNDGLVEFQRIDSIGYRIECKYNKDAETPYFTVSKTLLEHTIRRGDTLEMERMIICRGNYRIKNIYFDYSKTIIRPEGAKELDKLAGILRDNPTIELEICGHTDCTGSSAGNLAASLKRAKEVVHYLVSIGIPEKRLTAFGWGDSRPVNRCNCLSPGGISCTEEEHQQNRRVEFKIVRFK